MRATAKKKVDVETIEQQQKRAELSIFDAAQRVCPIIPAGIVEPSEKPDLIFKTATGKMGVEVCELLRPASGSHRPPVQAEHFHRQVIEQAKRRYYASSSKPVSVYTFFLDEEQCRLQDPSGWQWLNDRSEKKLDKMAQALAGFVREQVAAGVECKTYSRHCNLPAGFSVIRIATEMLGLRANRVEIY